MCASPFSEDGTLPEGEDYEAFIFCSGLCCPWCSVNISLLLDGDKEAEIDGHWPAQKRRGTVKLPQGLSGS